MENKDKWAIFDFCETLVPFQSADAFINFVVSKQTSKRIVLLDACRSVLHKIKVFAIFNRLFPGSLVEKKWSLFELKGLHKEDLEFLAKEFYVHTIRPSLIPVVLSELKIRQNEGCRIMVLSGGYSIYLKYFVDEFGLDGLVASDILFEDDVCKGRLDGLDCMRKDKIIRIENQYGTAFPWGDAIFYSDSKTDLPMLTYVGHGIVVSKSHSQFWPKEYSLDEIIWND